jgi:carboxypeptidase Q
LNVVEASLGRLRRFSLVGQFRADAHWRRRAILTVLRRSGSRVTFPCNEEIAQFDNKPLIRAIESLNLYEKGRIPMIHRAAGALALLALFSRLCSAADAPAVASGAADTDTLVRIRAAAMKSDWAWERLEELTDRIGARPSGSAGQVAAIAQVAEAMRELGAKVTLQPTKVPHWVRGEERAELTDYPGRPGGLTQRLHLTALGGSAATPVAGLQARVLVVRDFDDLHARAAQVRGNIVVFDSRFDQQLADNGDAGTAYGQSVQYRGSGPAEAAALGAVAALVRSAGGGVYRSPHTGVTRWKDKQTPIPAAALASEDADLIIRLAARGAVTMKLWLTPTTLPDADSFNVIADWSGRELPDQYVIVSGHLDSWDLGTGATDDGVGVMGAAGVVQVLQQLQLHARRSIRFIGWADEENGGQGAKTYRDSVSATIGTQCAAIESDLGAGRALGIVAAVTPESLETLKPMIKVLAPLGATVLKAHTGEAGADIAGLQEAGVPGFAPLVDSRHYFDYHHSAADTLDKVDPFNLQTQVATLAVLTYFLADAESCLPRAPQTVSHR